KRRLQRIPRHQSCSMFCTRIPQTRGAYRRLQRDLGLSSLVMRCLRRGVVCVMRPCRSARALRVAFLSTSLGLSEATRLVMARWSLLARLLPWI
ncbi:hypothetical protein GGI08_006852, partial [Coemansia sp. S2]